MLKEKRHQKQLIARLELSLALLRSCGMQISKRRREIIKLLQSGLSHREVGLKLGISKGAVSATLMFLRRRYGIADQAQLLRMVQHIDLDATNKTSSAGLRQTESGAWRASIWIHSKEIGLGTYCYAQKLWMYDGKRKSLKSAVYQQKRL